MQSPGRIGGASPPTKRSGGSRGFTCGQGRNQPFGDYEGRRWVRPGRSTGRWRMVFPLEAELKLAYTFLVDQMLSADDPQR